VKSVAVTIRAETVYGARHGLETLSQLVAGVPAPLEVAGRGRNTSRQDVLVMASNVRLSDAPVFRHRGLMLDTARHFLTLHEIQRTIDAMAASKLNVLHWHASDVQSFPLELPRVPQLARCAQSRDGSDSDRITRQVTSGDTQLPSKLNVGRQIYRTCEI